MIQITIKKGNAITNQASFEAQSDADAWIVKEVANKSFGKNDRTVSETDLSSEDIKKAKSSKIVVLQEAIPAKKEIVDADGNVIQKAEKEIPAVTAKEYFFEKEYEVVVEDITNKIDAEKTKAQEKKNKKSQALNALDAITDWSKVKSADVPLILEAIYKLLKE